MKNMKLAGLIVGIFSLFSISTAKADNLKLGNNTKYNLSFSINNICSNELGDVEKHSIKIINRASFHQACKQNPHQCVIDVYKKTSCMGKAVAGMVFDKTTIVSIAAREKIIISGNGLNVFFNEM